QVGTKLFERRLGNEDRVAVLQVLLHVGRRQIAEAIGWKLQAAERLPLGRVRLVLVRRLDVLIRAARPLALVPGDNARRARRRTGCTPASVVVDLFFARLLTLPPSARPALGC